jgi:hypothetical protein
MKKLDSLANEMIYGDIVQKIAEERNIGITEARDVVSKISFKEYQILEATVTPPSGSAIGPTTQPVQNQNDQANQAAASNASGAKGIWPGKGAPIEVGMTVGSMDRNNLPVPGTVTTVDKAGNGVKVKNPTTGQDQWMNIDSLQPYMVGGKPGTPAPGQPGNQTDQQGALAQTGKVAEDAELSRMLQLAGIQENCSGGATGAGAIAMAPTAMGGIRKREPAEEALKPEYTPKGPAKTIVGDTKPNQATGKLSADLAASGRKAAGRINNGKKRVR